MIIAALDVSLRILAAAAAVGLVLVLLRVRSGAARHAAWSAVLLAMLTMPVLVAIVPTVNVPVPSTLALDLREIAGGRPLDENSSNRPDVADAAVSGNADAQIPFARATLPAETGRGSSAEFASTIAPILPAIYALGLAFFAVRLARGWLLARRLVAKVTPVDVVNGAPVFESAAIATPLTTGIVRPSVVLPATWRGWPADKLAAVLAHENAHIARRDALVAFLAHVNRAIFWFHPLAWWLVRTLAVTAEHACDERAARAIGHPRRYAEVLLDMADAVRRRGHRVSWQTIGVDGSGLLGARIDRVLNGDAMTRMSRMQRAGVAVLCGAVLVLAVACRQQVAAEALRPDPELQKQLDEQKARGDRHKAAVAMTLEEAAALERALDANPNDREAREQLIIFYDQAGKVSWEQKLAGLRKHGLWRIAHLPETDLWIPHISRRWDPEGYAEAKKLWFEHAAKPDVTAKTLGRAAAFMDRYDKPAAEDLLLRAHTIDPGGPWASRLGDLYARAMVGTIDPRYGTVDEAEANSPFADQARRKLEGTTDPKILAAAGYELALRHREPDANEFGRRLLERAATLDPQNARARTGLARLQQSERHRQIQARLTAAAPQEKFDSFSDAMYTAVSALPEEDRLFYLPGAAESAYMRAEYIDYTASHKPEPAQAEARKKAGRGFSRARQFASDALALAQKHPLAAQNQDVIYRAETVLGVLALKDGDREAAVRHMRAAAAAAVSGAGRLTSSVGLRGRLVEYLLRAGERASVVEYLERSAERFPQDREQLLKDASRIRAGVMPMAYQHAEARASR